MVNVNVYSIRLSNRKAETAAAYLNGLGKGKITVAACRSQTAGTIARRFLGGKASVKEVDSLATNILENVGLLEKVQHEK